MPRTARRHRSSAQNIQWWIERKLLLFGLRVAVFLLCIFNNLRIAKKIIAQLPKKGGVYSIGPSYIGVASSRRNSVLILKHSRYNIITASS
jgi:hypothetical protein